MLAGKMGNRQGDSVATALGWQTKSYLYPTIEAVQTHPDRLWKAMVTIHRQHGFRFVIYVDDHEPAHVHVRGDGEMKVIIRGAEGLPQITYAVGMKTRDRRRVMDVVLERQEQFLSHWAEIHGVE